MTDTAVYRRLVEALPEPHALVALDGEVLHLNGAARRRVGALARLTTPSTVNGDGAVDASTALRAWSRSGSLRPMRVTLAVEGGRSDAVRLSGARVGDDVLLVRFDDPDQDGFRMLSLRQRSDHIDAVRERLDATLRSLEAANRALHRQNEDLAEYAAVVSHDLRAPLAVAEGAIELLQDDEGGEMSDQLLGVAERSLRHAHDAADTVLELIRITPSRPDRPVLMRPIIEEIGRELADLEIDATACVGQVYVPVPHLERLFRNLLTNAARYRHQERPPKVVVACRQSRDRRIVALTDNGRGIPPDEQERVFSLFRRGTGVEDGGAGVGLASCLRIARSYGGDLTVSSDGETGTTFTVDLPDG